MRVVVFLFVLFAPGSGSSGIYTANSMVVVKIETLAKGATYISETTPYLGPGKFLSHRRMEVSLRAKSQPDSQSTLVRMLSC